MESRKASEQRFFDDYYKSETTASSLNGFYEQSGAVRFFEELVFRDCAGLRILEYGCGVGGYAFRLAERGATAVGIDISEVAVQRSQARAAALPGAAVTFRVADAEALDFPDASFDLVCGTSILHHLDLSRSIKELRRVVKPGGRCVFYEPLAHNPMANLYRVLTPKLHTEDEHPLTMADLRAIAAQFQSLQPHFFDVFSVGAIPFLRLPGGTTLLRMLEALDRGVLSFKLVQPMATVVVLEMLA